MWVFVKRGKLENPGKNPQSKDKNYQQTLNPYARTKLGSH